jgi:hypothetical protein
LGINCALLARNTGRSRQQDETGKALFDDPDASMSQKMRQTQQTFRAVSGHTREMRAYRDNPKRIYLLHVTPFCLSSALTDVLDSEEILISITIRITICSPRDSKLKKASDRNRICPRKMRKLKKITKEPEHSKQIFSSHVQAPQIQAAR